MKTYLVGGAVRDELLGLPVTEKDYVVIGATPQEMLDKGFISVGKSFPVFLHPETKEEYALGRIERKVAGGYQGFTFDTSNVTLEEDLKRRDLTINAIAKDIDSNEIIDPYGGQNDLKKKILRHVSEAFLEDPVRVLRIARFAARFAPRGFKVAPETIDLMKEMVKAGELNYLIPERVFKEMQKAFVEASPSDFFEVLYQSNAMKVVLPEIDEAYKDNLNELKSILSFACQLTKDPVVRFVCIMHGSEQEQALLSLSKRLRLPNEYKDLALMIIKYYPKISTLSDPKAILTLLEFTDAFRREDRFKQFLLACEVIDKFKGHFKRDDEYLTGVRLLKALEIAKSVDLKQISQENKNGDIKSLVHQARLEAIKNWVDGSELEQALR